MRQSNPEFLLILFKIMPRLLHRPSGPKRGLFAARDAPKAATADTADRRGSGAGSGAHQGELATADDLEKAPTDCFVGGATGAARPDDGVSFRFQTSARFNSLTFAYTFAYTGLLNISRCKERSRVVIEDF